MIKDIIKVLMSFGRRCSDDHVGAYAGLGAYSLIISFIPFFMMFMISARQVNADTQVVTEALIAVIPAGLRDYVNTIILEVNQKSSMYMSLSVLILLWSASKVIHALTNGLNVISDVRETRGWFYLRFRSMLFVAVFLTSVVGLLVLSIYSQRIRLIIAEYAPMIHGMLEFIQSFQVIFSYLGLIVVFLLIYKFLPNCHYTIRSQLPGALIVSTVWMFLSYLIGIYYKHNISFTEIYGSLTGLILSMIWLYFCLYFFFIGAEINRMLFEDPEGNIFIRSLDLVKDANQKKQEQIEQELDEYSLWRKIKDDEIDLSAHYGIQWENEISDDSIHHK